MLRNFVDLSELNFGHIFLRHSQCPISGVDKEATVSRPKGPQVTDDTHLYIQYNLEFLRNKVYTWKFNEVQL